MKVLSAWLTCQHEKDNCLLKAQEARNVSILVLFWVILEATPAVGLSLPIILLGFILPFLLIQEVQQCETYLRHRNTVDDYVRRSSGTWTQASGSPLASLLGMSRGPSSSESRPGPSDTVMDTRALALRGAQFSTLDISSCPQALG